ncbi:hypothetical protein C7B80_14570 [Cyanosarcina cf. burmensis CCALA 770]|nr:hypothetical protein C7B80_14570 [Cyanosarcina cf. burmensis CCALA 770]
MSPKLKFALICRCSNCGFAMPIAMALGFIMILIATILVMRSQGDQTTAQAQKATAQSLAVAEGGITRTLATLNNSNPDIGSLLTRNYDPNGLLVGGSTINEWTASNMPPCTSLTDLLSGTIGSSTYEVLAYRYDVNNKTGTLLVKGQVPVGATSSESRVQQTFKIKPKNSTFIAVLGTDDIGLGNNDVRGTYGNVACTNTTKCPVTCPYTTASAKTAIGGLGSADVDGKIYIGSIPTPTFPTMPTVWDGTGTKPSTEFTVDLGTNLDNKVTHNFPRSSDFTNHIAGTPYHYKINSIDDNNYNINVTTLKDATKNPTGDPVYFWVSGKIDMGGSSQLNHNNSSNPTAFRIYGTSTTSQDMVVASGASDVDAFIFAPNARVGINGTGTIDGMVYAKSFGEVGANGNAVVNVPNNPNLPSFLSDLAVFFSYQIDSTNSWQRQAVP